MLMQILGGKLEDWTKKENKQDKLEEVHIEGKTTEKYMMVWLCIEEAPNATIRKT